MKLPRNNLTKRSSTATNIIAQAVFATQNNHQRERSQIVQIDKRHIIRLSSVPHFQSIAYAVEQAIRWDERIFAAELAQAPHNPSGRPYAGGIEVDHGSSPAKPKHLCLRDVHQAAGETRIQPPPWLSVPCVCTTWLPQKGRIDQEKVQAQRSLRYADGVGGQVADGC